MRCNIDERRVYLQGKGVGSLLDLPQVGQASDPPAGWRHPVENNFINSAWLTYLPSFCTTSAAAVRHWICFGILWVITAPSLETNSPWSPSPILQRSPLRHAFSSPALRRHTYSSPSQSRYLLIFFYMDWSYLLSLSSSPIDWTFLIMTSNSGRPRFWQLMPDPLSASLCLLESLPISCKQDKLPFFLVFQLCLPRRCFCILGIHCLS